LLPGSKSVLSTREARGHGLVFRGDATAGVPRCGSFAFSILHDLPPGGSTVFRAPRRPGKDGCRHPDGAAPNILVSFPLETPATPPNSLLINWAEQF